MERQEDMTKEIISGEGKSHEGWGGYHDDYYSQLPNQQNMLKDSVRTGTYNQAITMNTMDFTDKVVMDLGAGTGILSFFAAQAGARKVYAIEASDMAKNARTLVEANDLSDRIEVVQEKLENLELPEKVDVIVSEPMGILLIHERMMEMYALARRRWLKPGGKMFPSRGRIFFAPFSDNGLYSNYLNETRFWKNDSFHDIDLSSLAGTSLDHYVSRPLVGPVDPVVLVAEPSALEIDFTSIEPEQYNYFEIDFNFTATSTCLLHGLAGWFDVHFEGTNYLGHLCTAPSSTATHWYQLRFLFQQPVAINIGQTFSGIVKMTANNKRSYDILIEGTLKGTDVSIRQDFYLQNSFLFSPPTEAHESHTQLTQPQCPKMPVHRLKQMDCQIGSRLFNNRAR